MLNKWNELSQSNNTAIQEEFIDRVARSLNLENEIVRDSLTKLLQINQLEEGSTP